MKAILLLADAAQVAEGKLNLLGGGWSVTGPLPTPCAVAVKIDVPWNETNVSHHFELQLFTEDGEPVEIPGPDGEPRPVRLEGDFEVGRPPGLRPGTPIDVPLAVNIPPLPLPPDSRFTWRLSLDKETDPDWGGKLLDEAASARDDHRVRVTTPIRDPPRSERLLRRPAVTLGAG